LYASRSSNNLTITNNNITETPRGFYLYVPNSNNTITITNSRIIGVSYGLYLSADSSNNTITLINNNITGTSGNGVELYPYNSNNTLLSFVGNNITGNSVALYINSNNNALSSGLSLVNNTLNAIASNGIALYFNNTNVLSNILIEGNTINSTNIGISFYRNVAGMTVNMIANYNHILSPVGLNFTGVTDNSSNFDYNWWGTNDINGRVLDFNDINNHYILKILNLTSLKNLRTGDMVDFVFLVLNTTLTNVGVEYLPDFVIKVTLDGINYAVSRDDSFVSHLTVLSEGLNLVVASLDDAIDNLTFSASKANASKVNVTINAVSPNDSVGDTVNVVLSINNSSAPSAAMKNTGIPVITAVLVLLSILVICFTKKRDK